MTSQRVCAKILEFVFGRSIGTNSVEVGIRSGPVLEYTIFVYKSSRNYSLFAKNRSRQLYIAESANRTAVRNSSSSNGLVKKADAPAFSEVERTSGSSLPVNMMTRVDGESSRTRDCTSTPFMSGIQTSMMATVGR